MRSTCLSLLFLAVACSPVVEEPKPDVITFTATAGDVEADGDGKATLTLTVKSGEGAAKEGVKVTFSVPSPGVLTSAEEETDAAGEAQTQLSSTEEGELTVTATVSGKSHTAKVTFVEPEEQLPGTPVKLHWRYAVSDALGNPSLSKANFLRAVGMCVTNTYPCVEVRDSADEVVTTATNTVSISIVDCAAQFDTTASLPTPSAGAMQLAAAAGRAEFHAIKFSQTGTGCRLRAASTGLTEAFSSSFDVTD